MTQPGYYRYPTIHQDTILFVSEDDLWSVSAQGGLARRLTSNLGEVTRPSLSPDGALVAFVGREEGPGEIYVMPALGGQARRLTYLGGSLCATAGWTSDGQIIFASNSEHWYYRATRLYTISPQGGTPQALPFGLARSVTFGPQGGVLIGRSVEDPARWKRYRGGMMGQFWIDLDANGDFQRLLPDISNLASPMWLADGTPAGRIYFISDHEGVGNLYSCLPSGENVTRHTHHHDYYARNACSDGRRIVYHAGANVYVFDPTDNSSRQVDVQYHSPRVQRNRKFVDAFEYLEGFAIHPSGQGMAVTSRGKLFSFANWEGAVTRHSLSPVAPDDDDLNPGIRHRLPVWLPDGKRLLAVTDAPGEEAFVIFDTEPVGAAARIISGPALAIIPPGSDQLAAGSGEPADSTEAPGSDEATGSDSPLEDDAPTGSETAPPEPGTAVLTLGRPLDVAVHPSKDWLLFSNHRYELLLLDLQSEALTLIDRGVAGPMSGFAWSPDGDWVAYSVSTSLESSIIKLYHVPTRTSTPVTSPLLRDISPVFDPQGRYLYFISYRTFNPVYDAMHFELSFPRGAKPHLVTLRKDLRSPFIAKPRLGGDDSDDDDDKNEKDAAPDKKDPPEPLQIAEVFTPVRVDKKAAQDQPAGDDQPAQAQDDAEPTAEAEAPPPAVPADELSIDLDGIQERILAFPVSEGLYGRLTALRDGRVFYTRFPVEGANDQPPTLGEPSANATLYAYHLSEQREDMVMHGLADYRMAANGKQMVYRIGNRLRVIRAGEKPGVESYPHNRRTGWLDLSRVKAAVIPGAEWRQMYREAWRMQRDQFWSADMLQMDWLAIYERYQPLLERAGSRSEFSDLMWEMQGELGTSHAYEYGGDYRAEPRFPQGFLGADFEPHAASGGWRIGRIHTGDAWDSATDSPLHQPGLDIRSGDVLLAINGRRLSARFSPAMALLHLAGEEVSLSYYTPDDDAPDANPDAQAQTVLVKTLRSETPLRYREWVEANRRQVHQASEGQLGYIHIPDMGPSGYAEFHRAFLSETNRSGLVVDVRFNTGGHVSSLLLEKLARRRVGYVTSRWGQMPEPYPLYAIAGPLVALTNEWAGSDGDIFSHVFKLMKLGPLVGKRTWGGVVGITPSLRQVDGTIITQPEHAFWFTDVGWGVENYGTQPDIEVEIRPQDYLAGHDPQLARAIAEALRLLAANPPILPDFSRRPSRAAPQLAPI